MTHPQNALTLKVEGGYVVTDGQHRNRATVELFEKAMRGGAAEPKNRAERRALRRRHAR